jgi:hypothetical protein
MVNAIATPLGLSGENSLVLYQHTLPQRYVLTLPLVSVAVEKAPELLPAFHPSQAGSEALYYDRHGHLSTQNQKGLFVNTYF